MSEAPQPPPATRRLERIAPRDAPSIRALRRAWSRLAASLPLPTVLRTRLSIVVAAFRCRCVADVRTAERFVRERWLPVQEAVARVEVRLPRVRVAA
jgi:hypothetical protein